MVTRTLIQAVPFIPQRTKRAVELMHQTGGEIVWDEERNGTATFRKVMQTAGDDPVVILEDDVILATNWREQVEAVIAEHPDNVIQFFCPDGGDCAPVPLFRKGVMYHSTCCYYLPAGAAKGIIRDTYLKIAANMHDAAISNYLKRTKQYYWQHRPDLVQHEPWESSVTSRRKVRQSAYFAG